MDRLKDRAAAGHLLAQRLTHYADQPNVVALALPRGGVAVGRALADDLRCPLDVYVVRKLGAPGRPELAMGAIASGGVVWLDRPTIEGLHIAPEAIDLVIALERLELLRREEAYRGDRAPTDIAGKVVIVVDDGIATGATMRAASMALRAAKPARLVAAAPVIAGESMLDVLTCFDEVACVIAPDPLRGISLWYDDFRQLDDREVRSLLQRSS